MTSGGRDSRRKGYLMQRKPCCRLLARCVGVVLAVTLLASGCTSEDSPLVEGGLNFEVLGDSETGDPVASDPTGAVATDIEADFAALWAEVDGEPTGPLNGRVGVVANVGALYRNPIVVSVSGTDTWLIDISTNRRGECALVDRVRSPVVAIAVEADSPPESIEVTLIERPGCDG